MSGNPKNIQRDGLYCNIASANDLSWSTDSANTSNTLTVNADASVYVDYASANADSTAVKAIAGGNRTAIACYINQPIGDRTPYRVKAYAGAASGHKEWAIAIGYAPASPTGTGDSIAEIQQFPFEGQFDELITIEAEADGDTYFGRALCVALVCQGDTSGIGDYLKGHLSVQNLGVKPPTMQNAVS